MLSLDGGGSKGAYTLGVLRVVEELLEQPLSERFQLVYGTSTGAIIGSMVALGEAVDTIWERYQTLAPRILGHRPTSFWPWWRRGTRSERLRAYANEIYGDRKFDSFKTRIGIVATMVKPHEKPMIFKSHRDQLLANRLSFVTGFGSTIAEAVVASCSAYPFFDEVELGFGDFGTRTLVDGGHMANNPTPLALVDTVHSIRIPAEDVRVLSVGTGKFQENRGLLLGTVHRRSADFRRLMTLLESSTRTMEWLGPILFPDIDTVRIDEAHGGDDYRTSFLETDVKRLGQLYSVGVEDAEKRASELEAHFGVRARN